MTVPTAVAIASESPYTLEAGKALAEIGGNAVDIAVGAALTASVSGGIRSRDSRAARWESRTESC